MPTPATAPAPYVREMTAADIPAVCALAEKIWHAHYPSIISREQIDYMLQKMCSQEAIMKQYNEGQPFFVIEENNQLLGYTSLTAKKPGEWYLDKLYVDSDDHRRGLGHTLFTHAVQTLAPRVLTLRVNRANIKAINFYFKHGFSITALDVLQLEHGYVMDDFLMRWEA